MGTAPLARYPRHRAAQQPYGVGYEIRARRPLFSAYDGIAQARPPGHMRRIGSQVLRRHYYRIRRRTWGWTRRRLPKAVGALGACESAANRDGLVPMRSYTDRHGYGTLARHAHGAPKGIGEPRYCIAHAAAWQPAARGRTAVQVGGNGHGRECYARSTRYRHAADSGTWARSSHARKKEPHAPPHDDGARRWARHDHTFSTRRAAHPCCAPHG